MSNYKERSFSQAKKNNTINPDLTSKNKNVGIIMNKEISKDQYLIQSNKENINNLLTNSDIFSILNKILNIVNETQKEIRPLREEIEKLKKTTNENNEEMKKENELLKAENEILKSSNEELKKQLQIKNNNKIQNIYPKKLLIKKKIDEEKNNFKNSNNLKFLIIFDDKDLPSLDKLLIKKQISYEQYPLSLLKNNSKSENLKSKMYSKDKLLLFVVINTRIEEDYWKLISANLKSISSNNKLIKNLLNFIFRWKICFYSNA